MRLFHRLRCWFKDLCAEHETPFSVRKVRVHGPFAGYYACDPDWRTVDEYYCQECEKEMREVAENYF